MRDIKFRAWEKSDAMSRIHGFEGKMHYDIIQYLNDWLYSSEYVIMQFTGLKDKNGKEVYEGDILSHRGWVGQIVYKAPEYRFGDGESLFSISFKDFEIIGNIYENPELINP